MTDKRLGPPARDKVLAGILALFYLGTAAVAIVGLTDARRTTPGLIYFIGLLVVSVLALLSVAVGSRRSEAVVLVAIGIMSGLHGLLIGADTPTGLRIVIAPFALLPLAIYRSETVWFRRDVRRQLQEAEDRL